MFRGPSLTHLDIAKAHEDFGDVLTASGIHYAVLRPRGYSSDAEEFLKMARRGRTGQFRPPYVSPHLPEE